MSGLQCPVCDEVIEYADETGNRSLSQILGGGVSTAVADHTEKELRAHLETHDLEDFVTALVMADRYIAQVEAERDEAVAFKAQVESQVAAMRAAPPPRTQQAPPGPEWTPGPPPGLPADNVFAQQQRAPRRQHVDPDQSLIPFVSPGQRAEGQVGRRR